MSPTDHGFRPGPVKTYVLTGGRTRPKATLPAETLIIALRNAPVSARTNRQQRDLLRLCRGQLGLAEVAAHLKLPMSVARILASDLIDAGLLGVRDPGQDTRPKLELMEQVLAGLRKL
ncbi:DUF742 domain-containing protein [Amycolatopsis sp. OK19-0408]|uniref:DUF742 domain-containing protein n=1 Tax=Amycolatopsis iheyensis TaxID=2945988 RepID=A0A9X2SQB1_9PSEU|nr:DUF742 domain-containing protein [Amycolatopsis iheyensis]MCR6488335.1 DUF742 domain-containing protein [Amycolatopsis iheyensis]